MQTPSAEAPDLQERQHLSLPVPDQPLSAPHCSAPSEQFPLPAMRPGRNLATGIRVCEKGEQWQQASRITVILFLDYTTSGSFSFAS